MRKLNQTESLKFIALCLNSLIHPTKISWVQRTLKKGNHVWICSRDHYNQLERDGKDHTHRVLLDGLLWLPLPLECKFFWIASAIPIHPNFQFQSRSSDCEAQECRRRKIPHKVALKSNFSHRLLELFCHIILRLEEVPEFTAPFSTPRSTFSPNTFFTSLPYILLCATWILSRNHGGR